MATQQEIDAAYQEILGRPPDPSGIETYSDPSYSAEDLAKELSTSPEKQAIDAGMTLSYVPIGDTGKQLMVYGDVNLAEGDTFTMSHKEGDIFAVPQGTPVSGARNYEKVGTKEINGEQYDIYQNAGSQGEGLSGIVENVTGVDLDKIVPNEVKSGIIPIPGISDPLGVSQGIVFGEGANEGTDYLADITGLKPEEILLAQDIGLGVVSVGTGNPYLAAGAVSLKETSDTAKTDEDWVDLGKNVALNFAIAGTLDMAGKLLTSAPSPSTPPAFDAPSGYDATGATALAGGPDAATIANVMPEGVYPINNTTAGLDTSVTNPVADSTVDYGASNYLDFYGAPPATDSAFLSTTVPGTSAPSMQEQYLGAAKAALEKPWYKDPSILLPVAGLGLSVYGLLSRPSPDDLLDEKTAAEKEIIDYQSEKNMEMLKAQQEFAAEQAAEDRAPVPSKAPPSMYTKKYGVS